MSTPINTPLWINFIQYGAERIKEVGVEVNYAKKMLDIEKKYDEFNYQSTMFTKEDYVAGVTRTGIKKSRYAGIDNSFHIDYKSSGTYSSGLSESIFDRGNYNGKDVITFLENSISTMKTMYTQDEKDTSGISAGHRSFDGGSDFSHQMYTHLPRGLVVETGHGEIKKNPLILANLRETAVNIEKMVHLLITMINAQAEAMLRLLQLFLALAQRSGVIK